MRNKQKPQKVRGQVTNFFSFFCSVWVLFFAPLNNEWHNEKSTLNVFSPYSFKSQHFFPALSTKILFPSYFLFQLTPLNKTVSLPFLSFLLFFPRKSCRLSPRFKLKKCLANQLWKVVISFLSFFFLHWSSIVYLYSQILEYILLFRLQTIFKHVGTFRVFFFTSAFSLAILIYVFFCCAEGKSEHRRKSESFSFDVKV